MDLQLVATEELVNELLSRFDAAVFAGGKDMGGVWTTFNEWRSHVGPYTALGLLEQFKHGMVSNIEGKTRRVADDEPGRE
jgi:hypothetical protein